MDTSLGLGQFSLVVCPSSMLDESLAAARKKEEEAHTTMMGVEEQQVISTWRR
jgi:hypothetical protein